MQNVLWPVNHKCRIIHLTRVRANHLPSGYLTGRWQEVLVHGNLPIEDIAVVSAPSINHLNLPRAVEWTADKGTERIIGTVEIASGCYIRRVDPSVVFVRTAVYYSIIVGIHIPRISTIAPTIVPPHARPIAILCRVACVVILHVVSLAQVCP